jgi:hypothetical protein
MDAKEIDSSHDSHLLESLDTTSAVKGATENDAAVDAASQLLEVRGTWEFIAASQFLVLFHDIFGLDSFNTRVNLICFDTAGL